MPDHQPVARYNFQNAWPKAPGGSESHSFTIKLQDATVGRAKAMTDGAGAFGATRPGSPVVGHELTHTLQQRPGAAPHPSTEEVSFVFQKITWDLGSGTPPDQALRTRTGQTVQVLTQNRKVVEGRLKSVARHGHTGEDWVLTLTGVRRS